jgi:hypothetical protein
LRGPKVSNYCRRHFWGVLVEISIVSAQSREGLFGQQEDLPLPETMGSGVGSDDGLNDVEFDR